jgi:hypothetical protein
MPPVQNSNVPDENYKQRGRRKIDETVSPSGSGVDPGLPILEKWWFFSLERRVSFLYSFLGAHD